MTLTARKAYELAMGGNDGDERQAMLWVSVLNPRFEAAGDGTTDDTAAVTIAIATAAILGGELVLPKGTYKITSSLTIPSTVTLRPLGGMFSLGTGVTLTINGAVHAGNAQIFSGGGSVVLTMKAGVLNPKWWGATGNGVTDDTVAIQAAIDCAAVAGVEIYTPPGNYVVSATLGRTSVSGMVFRGSGASVTGAPGSHGSGSGAFDSMVTLFTWQGNATSPMFQWGDLRTSTLEKFSINAGVAFPLLSGIDLCSFSSAASRGGGTTPCRNTLRRISMNGGNGYLLYGVRWVGAGSQYAPANILDANNDFTLCEGVEVSNHGRVGFEIGHSQAYTEMFINCVATGNAALTAQAGVSCGTYYDGAAWTSAVGGTFVWLGGFLGIHQEADFVFGTPSNSGSTIDSLNSEDSARLVSFPAFTSTQGSNSGGPLDIRGIRWAHDTHIAADKYFIDYHAPGPLTVRGCAILDSGSGNALKIRMVAGTATKQTLRVEDTYIESTAADTDLYDLAGSNTASTTVYLSGNRRMDRSAAQVQSRWTDEPDLSSLTVGGLANGQLLSIQTLTELTTIAAAATTDTTIQMPAGALILGVSVRVTVVIPTAAGFTVGDSGSAARFSTAAVAVAANSTDKGTKAGCYYNAGALAVRITPDVQPAANTGRVRVTITYLSIGAPSS